MVRRDTQHVAQHYREFTIQTAPRSRAVYLLHERCTVLISQARTYTEKRRVLLDKAQNILTQLYSSLIGDDPVTTGLMCLYDYCYCLLERGDDKSIEDAHTIFRPLKETFQTLLKNP